VSFCIGTSYKTAGMVHVKKLVFFQYSYEHEQESTKTFSTLRTGDADLRFYITTVQDG